MNRNELAEFLTNYQDGIVGISLDNYFYNVDYITEWNIEFNDEPVIRLYEVIDDQHGLYITSSELTMNDLLKYNSIEFFKHTKIER